VYLVILLWYYDRSLVGINHFVPAAAAVFSLVFALTFFHPQYAIWVVPFLALAITRQPALLPLHVIQIALLMLHTLQWGASTTTELFLPVSTEAVSLLPDPRNVIAAQIAVAKNIVLMREPPVCFGTAASSRTSWVVTTTLAAGCPPAAYRYRCAISHTWRSRRTRRFRLRSSAMKAIAPW
jgi:hypothetical protein